MKMLIRRGVLVEEEHGCSGDLADVDASSNEARVLRPLPVAACTHRIAFGPRAGQQVLTEQGVIARDPGRAQDLCADQQGFSLYTAVRCDAMPTSASARNSFAGISRPLHLPTNTCRSTSPDR